MQQCEQWDTTLNVIIIGQIHFFTVIGQYINSKVFFYRILEEKKFQILRTFGKEGYF